MSPHEAAATQKKCWGSSLVFPSLVKDDDNAVALVRGDEREWLGEGMLSHKLASSLPSSGTICGGLWGLGIGWLVMSLLANEELLTEASNETENWAY